MRVIAAILAAGSGVRLGSETPKQLLRIAGRTVLEHAVMAFERHEEVDEIIVVTRQDLVLLVRELLAGIATPKVSRVIAGGETRSDSTAAALAAVGDATEAKILIHDGVRPFVTHRIISDCIAALDNHRAVDVAIMSSDTIIEVEADKEAGADKIVAIPHRARMRRGQTPQGFDLATLRAAYAAAAVDSDFVATDDCGVVARYLPEVAIAVVNGSESNIKITHPVDVYLADKLFQLNSLTGNEFDADGLRPHLAGKILVVFGASSGIGSAIVDLAEDLGATCHAYSRALTGTDVADLSQVEKALEAAREASGGVDYVVSTVGRLRVKPLDALDEREIDELVAANYLSAINIAKASQAYLAATNGQLLLFTSSSFTRGRAFYSVYSSSKAAVVNLAQALAEEWSALGIRVNCMNPERTMTPMRVENFGREDPATLLPAETVAQHALQTLTTRLTGQVVDVRR